MGVHMCVTCVRVCFYCVECVVLMSASIQLCIV